jgi:hypothetical protein
VTEITDAQGNLIGWLAIDGNQLKRYSADFSSGQTVTTFTTDVAYISTNIGPTIILLRIDNALRAYNVSTNALSTSLYDFVHSFAGCCGGQDATFTYFFDTEPNVLSATSKIIRLPSDGSAAATTLVTETGFIAVQQGLTTNRVVYSLLAQDNTLSIKTVAKTGGLGTLLESVSFFDASLDFAAVKQTTVYYNNTPVSGTGVKAVRINEDGTGKVETTDAIWAGVTMPTTCEWITDGFCHWPDKILRLEGAGINVISVTGATVKSYLAANNSFVATLGTIPAGIETFLANSEFGNRGLATVSSSFAVGLFYFDAGTANSLVKVNESTAVGDFDGDGKSDVGIYRAGLWAIRRSSDNGTLVDSLGGAADTPVSADYDGDGKNDIAVYSNGLWTIKRSSDGGITTVGFGGPTFTPVPGDYDGDGKADIAVFSGGVWSILRSSDRGNTVIAHGGPGWTPVPGDYDGDGKTDVAVYINGAWSIKQSSNNSIVVSGHGGPSWTPVPADYDGDGKTDIAVYTGGAWSVKRSSDNVIAVTGHGGPSWTPVPADYDGDGKTDIAVYNAAGAWSIKQSSNNTINVIGHGGGPTDVPLKGFR